MVKIDSKAIIVEPLKSWKNSELTWAHHVLVMRLKRAGIVPKKHVLDNEVSDAMKDVICNKYKMEMKLYPLVAIDVTRLKWQFENSKRISSAFSLASRTICHCLCRIDCYHKQNSLSICCVNQM